MCIILNIYTFYIHIYTQTSAYITNVHPLCCSLSLGTRPQPLSQGRCRGSNATQQHARLHGAMTVEASQQQLKYISSAQTEYQTLSMGSTLVPEAKPSCSLRGYQPVSILATQTDGQAHSHPPPRPTKQLPEEPISAASVFRGHYRDLGCCSNWHHEA